MDISGSLTDAFLRDIGLREMYLVSSFNGKSCLDKNGCFIKTALYCLFCP